MRKRLMAPELITPEDYTVMMLITKLLEIICEKTDQFENSFWKDKLQLYDCYVI